MPLVFVHVHDPAGSDEDAARLLCDATAPWQGELVIESGHPADRLVELARKLDAAFLVVGNHGPRSSFLGSVSADVARRARCPVVVVPPGIDGTEMQVTPGDTDVEGAIVRLGLSRVKTA